MTPSANSTLKPSTSNKAFISRISLKFKLTVLVALIQCLVLSLLVWNSVRILVASNQESLLSRAQVSVNLLLAASKDAILVSDLATLEDIANDYMGVKGTTYVTIMDSQGRILVQKGEVPARFNADTRYAAVDDDVFDVSVIYEIGGISYGEIQTGLSVASIREAAASTQRESFTFVAIEILISALVSIGVGTYLTRPLNDIRDGSHNIAAGDYGYTIPVRGSNELASSAEAFNAMSATLLDLDNKNKQTMADLADSHRNLEQKIQDRTHDLQTAKQRSEQLISVIPSFLIRLDHDGAVVQWNGVAEQLFGYPSDQVMGKPFSDVVIQWDTEQLDTIMAGGRLDDVVVFDQQQQRHVLTIHVSPIVLDDGHHDGVLISGQDQTEYKALQDRWLQAKKMESVGVLAAGMAHEMNTPIQYIGDNLQFLKTAIEKLMAIPAVDPKEEKLKGFLKDQVPEAVEQSSEGLGIIANIVGALRSFAEVKLDAKEPFDLHQALRDAVELTRHKWQACAQVNVDLKIEDPTYTGVSGEIKQVFLGLLLNAIQAIEDKPGSETGTIGVLTESLEEGGYRVLITDSGVGIPPKILDQIFEPFFTTRDVGSGMGQGLSTAYNTIVRHHNGKLYARSVEGEGTTFIVELPGSEPS